MRRSSFRVLDKLPESKGIHVLRCRGCGRKFEKIGMPDPDDPLNAYCGECLLKGNIRGGGGDG